MTDIEAGWALLGISGAAWLFYLGSRALEEYRYRYRNRQSLMHWMTAHRENVRR